MKVQERIADYAELTQPMKLRPLGEVIKPTRPRVKPSEKPHLPFIGMEHVEAHTMRLLGMVPASTMKSSAVHFHPGDVLYGRLRPYLNKVYRPDFEGLCSAEFIVFPKTESLNSRYLQYFLNSAEFVSFATNLNAGDRPRVDFDQLAPYPFPVAPLDQQKRIVAEIEKHFSRLDEAVANLKRVKANLKRYKAAVLKAAVEGRLVETEAELARREGRSYETGAQLLQRILETHRSQWQGKGKYKEPAAPDTTDLPELPEGWIWGTFGHLCQIQGGYAFKSGNYQPHGVPLVRISNLVNGSVQIKEDTVFLPKEFLDEFVGFRLQKGDTLIAMSGATTGKMATFNLNSPALLNQRVGRFRPTVLSLIVPGYISLLAMQASGKVLADAYGAAQPNISPTEIEAMPVGVPPLVEQNRIIAEVDRRLSLLRETEAQVDVNLKRAERLRQSILSQAFAS